MKVFKQWVDRKQKFSHRIRDDAVSVGKIEYGLVGDKDEDFIPPGGTNIFRKCNGSSNNARQFCSMV